MRKLKISRKECDGRGGIITSHAQYYYISLPSGQHPRWCVNPRRDGNARERERERSRTSTQKLRQPGMRKGSGWRWRHPRPGAERGRGHRQRPPGQWRGPWELPPVQRRGSPSPPPLWYLSHRDRRRQFSSRLPRVGWHWEREREEIVGVKRGSVWVLFIYRTVQVESDYKKICFFYKITSLTKKNIFKWIYIFI